MVKNRRKILLAVDGSDQAFEAVRYVSRLFQPNRMEVILFHVTTKVPENFWDVEKEPAYRHKEDTVKYWELQQEKERQDFMERARWLLLDQNVSEDAVIIKIQERKVGIARDIINESRNDYDGVVVGRWGTSLLKDFLWGSIANKLLGRLTHVPLCVVGGCPQIGKILVAIDASKGAMKAVDFVGTMADSTNWEVTLLHAVRGIESEELYKTEKSMEAVFEEATHHLVKAGLNRDQITTRIVTGVTSRAAAISVEALRGGYGTIIVGRRGLSDVKEFNMGRVSNKVIHMAREIAVWLVA